MHGPAPVDIVLHVDVHLVWFTSAALVWNFVVGAVYVLSVGPAAYGAGKVEAGEQDGASLGTLAVGQLLGR